METTLVDVRHISEGGGIPLFQSEVLRILSGKEHCHLLCLNGDKDFLLSLGYKKRQLISTGLSPYNFVHVFALSVWLYTKGFSKIYFTFYSGVFFCRSVVFITVHDLYYRRDGYFFKNRLLNGLKRFALDIVVYFSLRCASKVHFVSKTSFEDSFQVSRGRTEIIPLAGRRLSCKKQIRRTNSWLYVGNSRSNKNYEWLVEFFRLHPQHSLIVAGSAFNPRISNIKHLGIVDDDELCRLYSSCRGLILPSFYEGFGLTVVEAIEKGCPVLSSGRGSLREFDSKYIVQFDNMSFRSLKDSMEILPEPDFTDEYFNRKYSWVEFEKKFLHFINS